MIELLFGVIIIFAISFGVLSIINILGTLIHILSKMFKAWKKRRIKKTKEYYEKYDY